MKTKLQLLAGAVAALLVVLMFVSFKTTVIDTNDIKGAWEYGPADKHTLMIATDKIFSVVTYDGPGKKLITAYGGKWHLEGGKLIQAIEWNSADAQQVGRVLTADVSLKNKKLVIGLSNQTFTRIDDGTGELSGAWVITGNYENDKVSKRPNPFYPRRTMKVLAGSRFHWIAYNVEAKQFINAGGGDYTARDGNYTEHIDFFTKTPESVGKTVSFQYSFVDGDWRHKGQKSHVVRWMNVGQDARRWKSNRVREFFLGRIKES